MTGKIRITTMPPEFDEVREEDRRFKNLDVPKDWPHDIPPELLKQLEKADEIKAERWVLLAVMAKKIDWSITRVVEVNNNCFLLEADVIRSRKFRQYVWQRVTIISSAVVVIFQFVLPWLWHALTGH